MPKTAVYQLRLTPEEKAKLAATARGREVSIAAMIRKDYELDVEAPGASKRLPEKSPPAGPGVLEQMSDARTITTLARQKYGHLPLGLAERKVREEMAG